MELKFEEKKLDRWWYYFFIPALFLTLILVTCLWIPGPSDPCWMNSSRGAQMELVKGDDGFGLTNEKGEVIV